MGTADRKILIGAGAAFVVLTGLTIVVSPPAVGLSTSPTSYAAGAHGAKGAYLLLKDLGYGIERWERPPTDLQTALIDDPGTTILILAGPTLSIAQGEREALKRYLRTGGHILATGEDAAKLVPGWEESSTHIMHGADWRTYRSLYPSHLSQEASIITMAAESRWTSNTYRAVALYGEPEDPVVLTARIGDGRLVWWAGATPLTNAGIQSAGNLALFLDAMGDLGVAEETTVLWDEYYHGHRGTLRAYLTGTPAAWGLLQAGVIFLAMVATYARRFGPVIPPPATSRLGPLEFSETVGGLYERAHASSAAVEIAYHRFRSLLTRRLGVPVSSDLKEISRRLPARMGVQEQVLMATLREAEAAVTQQDLEERRALKLVQTLHSHACALGLIPPNSQETS